MENMKGYGLVQKTKDPDHHIITWVVYEGVHDGIQIKIASSLPGLGMKVSMMVYRSRLPLLYLDWV